MKKKGLLGRYCNCKGNRIDRKEALVSMPIVTPCDRVEEIRTRLRQTPLGAVREMLPDRAILEACQACGHAFRRRQKKTINITKIGLMMEAGQ
jgi:hypothetical protein